MKPAESQHAKRPRKVRGFMCAIDWAHELGEALGGNRVYPSAKDLKENHAMSPECGIVEVEVRFVRTVKKGKL